MKEGHDIGEIQVGLAPRVNASYHQRRRLIQLKYMYNFTIANVNHFPLYQLGVCQTLAIYYEICGTINLTIAVAKSKIKALNHANNMTSILVLASKLLHMVKHSYFHEFDFGRCFQFTII